MYKVTENGEEKIFHSLISSIELSLNTKNWYSAIFLSLALPDICSSVDNPNTHQSGKRYIEWFSKYVRYRDDYENEGYGYLSGEDCYALRCSMFHQGVADISMQKRKKAIDKVAFLATGEGFKWHNNKHKNNIVTIDIIEFSLDMINACQKWIEVIINDNAKMTRLQDVLQIRDLSHHTPQELFKMFTGTRNNDNTETK